MRILLIGEYSNVHNTLAEGLRKLGHKVCVASNGDFWKDYPRDIDLRHELTPAGSISFMWRLMRALPKMKGFDVVQLINPIFMEMKANRLIPIYKYLRRNNRHIVLGAFGMDHYWVKVNTDDKPLRYSDFNIGNQVRHNADTIRETSEWIGTDKEILNKYIAHDCDAIVAGLYEYWVTYQEYGNKLTFIPYPIRPEGAKPSEEARREGSPLRIFVGISRKRHEYKGTDIMLRAAEDVQKIYPGQVDIVRVNGVPFAEYEKLMDSSDCILDQLYSYTPAMNALLAMSKGIIVVGGGEPENYDILNENELRPIVNVEPTYESCFEQIERLVLNPHVISDLKHQSRQYIDRHHDYMKVARQYESLYATICESDK